MTEARPGISMKPRIGVTGSGGFIGANLVESLVADGYDVSCLVRRRDCPPGSRAVRGDLADAASLDRFVADRDIVIHLAGLTRARSERDFLEANALGTERLADAITRADSARRAAGEPAFGRLVLLSSQAVCGPAALGEYTVEDAPLAPLTAYARSKARSERVLAERPGLPWTVIRSPAVYGPRDRDFLPMFRLMRRRGFYPVLGKHARFSHAYVGNLVHGIRLAMENPAAEGKTYFIADDLDSTWESFAAAAQVPLGRSAKPLVVPFFVIAVAGYALSAARPFFREPPLLNAEKLRELRQPRWVVSIEKARAELGYEPPFGFSRALELTVAWYRERDLL